MSSFPTPSHNPSISFYYTIPYHICRYGSYGACIDPVFDYKKTALLDRGVVFAIAHIRGGGEMGRAWYTYIPPRFAS